MLCFSTSSNIDRHRYRQTDTDRQTDRQTDRKSKYKVSDLLLSKKTTLFGENLAWI